MTVPSSWEAELFDSTIDVDWQHVGADWDRYFSLAVRALAGGNLQGFQPWPGEQNYGMRPFVEYRLSKKPVRFQSRLRLIPSHPAKLKAIALGDGDKIESELAVWREAIARATSQVAREQVSFSWTAILGATGNPVHLVSGDDTRPVRISSTRRKVRLAAERTGTFEPIFTEGLIDAPGSAIARLIAREQAGIAAAIMSVAWDVYVDVQCNPWFRQERESAPGLVDAPDAWSDDQKWDRAMPPWWGAAWDLVANDRDVKSALLIYHEGLRLNAGGQASFAFAAFVASLEAVGARSVDLSEKCPQCGAQTGAFRRFRAALEMVTEKGSRTYKRLHAGYKEFRSTTVHVGTLHGGERTGNLSLHSNPFIVRPDELFESWELPLMRNHARRLIESQLSGRIST